MTSQQQGFQATFRRIAPVSVVVTVGVDAYAWTRQPHLQHFLDHLIFYHLAVLIGHAYLVWLLCRPTAEGTYVEEDCPGNCLEQLATILAVIDGETSILNSDESGCGSTFNIDGTPMMGDFDIHGNPYGVTSND